MGGGGEGVRKNRFTVRTTSGSNTADQAAAVTTAELFVDTIILNK